MVDANVRNGFTLVELMVAILVLALAAGAVSLSLGSIGSTPAADAERLASRISAARETAITTARPMSVWVSRSGYGFEARSRAGWRAMNAKPFEPTDWPAGTELAIEGAGSGARGVARVTFDNLGLPESSAAFELRRNGERTRVRVAANGQVKVG